MNQIKRAFPGDYGALPDSEEWDRAEQLLRDKGIETILDRFNPNPTCYFSPRQGNRAYLHSQLKRAFIKHGIRP